MVGKNLFHGLPDGILEFAEDVATYVQVLNLVKHFIAVFKPSPKFILSVGDAVDFLRVACVQLLHGRLHLASTKVSRRHPLHDKSRKFESVKATHPSVMQDLTNDKDKRQNNNRNTRSDTHNIRDQYSHCKIEKKSDEANNQADI